MIDHGLQLGRLQLEDIDVAGDQVEQRDTHLVILLVLMSVFSST